MGTRLEGLKAIVTGSGAGIGRAIAIRFAEEGAAVAVLDLNGESAQETASLIKQQGGTGYSFSVDVSDALSVNTAVSAAINELGGVNILVNNAGILDKFANLLDTSEELWDRVIDVDLKSMFLVSKSTVPTMLENGGGVIVNTASIAGVVAGGGGIAYTSAKHGVIGFTKQLAADFGPRGVRANAICPGAVNTALTREAVDAGLAPDDSIAGVPARRMSEPEEIANLALFLASSESDFVHGAAYLIDGGWTAI